MKIFSLAVLVFMITFYGCGNDTGKNEVKKDAKSSELIRSEGSDVTLLDKNGDGMLYQCPMDFQVISDTFGVCPVCKMDLMEYSVADAQTNLDKHYHK